MMDWFRGYLLGLVGAALAVALAQALTPEGTVKRAGKLIGAMVLLLAVCRPLLSLDPAALTASAWTGREDLPAAEAAGQAALKGLIEEETGAYVVDKGAALGCTVAAEVTAQVDDAGWPVPWAVTLTGQWTPEQREALSAAIAEELAIPPARQTFREEEP